MAVTSTSLAGVAEGTEDTADAAGVVGEGAVAESIVVVGGSTEEGDAAVACRKILAIRSANIPIVTRYAVSKRVASRFSTGELTNTKFRGCPFVYLFSFSTIDPTPSTRRFRHVRKRYLCFFTSRGVRS